MKVPEFDPNIMIPKTPRVANTKGKKQEDPEALRKASQEFEAIFIQSMFKRMRATVPEGGFLKKGNGEKMFQDLMDMEAAKEAAATGNLGIGEALFRQLQADLGPEEDEGKKTP